MNKNKITFYIVSEIVFMLLAGVVFGVQVCTRNSNTLTFFFFVCLLVAGSLCAIIVVNENNNTL